jgi:hypothetical protein
MKRNWVFASAVILGLGLTACGPSKEEQEKLEKDLTEQTNKLMEESMGQLEEDLKEVEEPKEEDKKTSTSKKPAAPSAIETIKDKASDIKDTKTEVSSEGKTSKVIVKGAQGAVKDVQEVEGGKRK